MNIVWKMKLLFIIPCFSYQDFTILELFVIIALEHWF